MYICLVMCYFIEGTLKFRAQGRTVRVQVAPVHIGVKVLGNKESIIDRWLWMRREVLYQCHLMGGGSGVYKYKVTGYRRKASARLRKRGVVYKGQVFGGIQGPGNRRKTRAR